MAGAEGLAACFALLCLADRCRATVPGSPLLAKKVHRAVFLTLRPSRIQVLIKKRAALLRLFHSGRGRRTCRVLRTLMARRPLPFNSTRSPLLAKNSPQDCFLDAQTLSGSSPYQKKSRTSATLSLWQGQKDLNPRHVVLETTALPTELYPYIKLVGHQGLEPRTDRL